MCIRDRDDLQPRIPRRSLPGKDLLPVLTGRVLRGRPLLPAPGEAGQAFPVPPEPGDDGGDDGLRKVDLVAVLVDGHLLPRKLENPGFGPGQDLAWVDAPVTADGEGDDACHRREGGYPSAEKFRGHDRGGDGGVGRAGQDRHEAYGAEQGEVEVKEGGEKGAGAGADEKGRRQDAARPPGGEGDAREEGFDQEGSPLDRLP